MWLVNGNRWIFGGGEFSGTGEAVGIHQWGINSLENLQGRGRGGDAGRAKGEGGGGARQMQEDAAIVALASAVHFEHNRYPEAA